MVIWSLKRPLHETQRIKGCRKNAACRYSSCGDVSLIRSDQDEKLANEITEPRKSKRRERKEQPGAAQARYCLPEATHGVDLTRLHALLYRSGNQEKRPDADCVRDYRHHRAAQRERVAGEDRKQHESEVANAGIGDKAHEIGLGEGQEGAIQDSNNGE